MSKTSLCNPGCQQAELVESAQAVCSWSAEKQPASPSKLIEPGVNLNSSPCLKVNNELEGKHEPWKSLYIIAGVQMVLCACFDL